MNKVSINPPMGRTSKRPPRKPLKRTVGRATKSVKSRHPRGGLTPRQQTAIVALVSGASDESAGKAAGVCRQTVSEWRTQPQFIRALNVEQNRLGRRTMKIFRDKMAALTKAAIDEIGKSIARGDAQTARWLLEKVEIGNFARKIFETEVNPVILPEDTGAILDELAGKRVDDFLTAKGIGALDRLRIREAMKAKEAEALREEFDKNDDAEE